jgi:hypothetical protein
MTTKNELVKQLPSADTNLPAEPALAMGISVTSIVSCIVLIVSLFFHKQIPDDIQTLIYAVLTLLLPMITAWLIRRKVWSPASVVKVVDKSVEMALQTASALNSPQVKLLPNTTPSVSKEAVEKFKKDFFNTNPE